MNNNKAHYLSPIKEHPRKQDNFKKHTFEHSYSTKLIYSKDFELENTNEENELDYIIKLLEQKNKSKNEIKEIKDYLCNNIDYFKNLSSKADNNKLLKLISVLNFETFNPNQYIMYYGEEGTKFYILLKGRVGIYKPVTKTKNFTLKEYIEYLLKIRDIEKNPTKFERIINYNSSTFDKYKLLSLEYDLEKISNFTKIFSLIIEEDRLLDESGAGKSFGEMALIKDETRNASILALEKCELISISKMDYRIVKDIERQRINKDLEKFKLEYPFFKYWGGKKCIKLMSGLITEIYNKDDFVYKQNDIPDAVYLIKEGNFEIFCNFNFSKYEDFIEYIHNPLNSLVNDMNDPLLWKEDKIRKKIKNVFSDENENNFFNENKNIENDDRNNLYNLSNDNKRLYKANIQNLTAPYFFGFLEIIELKKRFFSVKCTSNRGIIMKFPMMEFLQLLPIDEQNKFYLQKNIFDEKKRMIEQLRNNTIIKLKFVNYGDGNKIDNYSKYKIINNNTSNIITRSLKNVIVNKIKINKSNNDKNLLEGEKNNNLVSNYNENKKFDFNILKNSNDFSKDYLLGFKNSILKLNKKKINIIKELYPKSTKNMIYSSNTMKNVNKSQDYYMKYLDSNIPITKTSSKMRSIIFNGQTAKSYHNFDCSSKIKKDCNKSAVENYSCKNIELPKIKVLKRNLINDYGKTINRLTKNNSTGNVLN